MRHTIKVMAAGFDEAFRSMDGFAEPRPVERHHELRRRVHNRSHLAYPDLARYALDSFQLLGFSSHHKAVQAELTNPADVARRSTGLLRLADIDHDSERAFHVSSAYSMPIRGNLHIIHPDRLRIVGEPEELAVDFTAQTQATIEAVARPGCPASRQMLQNFYERYVDIVFDTPS